MRHMVMIPYLAVKLVAYAAWCRVALRALHEDDPSSPDDRQSAWVYGAVRVAVGLMLGFILSSVLSRIAPAPNRLGISTPVLLPALALSRVFEWLAVGGMMVARATGPMPSVGRQVLWIGGGVVFSFVIDAVLAVGLGTLAVLRMPC